MGNPGQLMVQLLGERARSRKHQSFRPTFTTIGIHCCQIYAKVDGKWVIPNEGRNNTPSGGSKPYRNSTEASRSETRTGVRFLDNVTGDQSFPLPEPNREFATASSEIDSKISQNKPNIQANGPMIGIKKVNAAMLLSQLEHFLEENGSFKPDKKPIKFKDAVGKKFSFPFELAGTWAVSGKFTSCIL